MDKYLEIGGKISQFWFFPLSTGCLNNYPRILFSDEIVLKIVLFYDYDIFSFFIFENSWTITLGVTMETYLLHLHSNYPGDELWVASIIQPLF